MFDNAKLYCSERKIPGYLKKRIKNFYLSFTDGFYESFFYYQNKMVLFYFFFYHKNIIIVCYFVYLPLC